MVSTYPGPFKFKPSRELCVHFYFKIKPLERMLCVFSINFELFLTKFIGFVNDTENKTCQCVASFDNICPTANQNGGILILYLIESVSHNSDTQMLQL